MVPNKPTKQFVYINSAQGGSMIYFLGFLESATYYVSTSKDFWMGVVGILKALVWPAFLTYGAFKYLGL